MINNGCIISGYSAGSVHGTDYVGGLIGEHEHGYISSTYSVASVYGDRRVSGLVGHSFGGQVYSSFWDIETSGLDASARGEGLLTVDMQNVQTYQDSGWDLVDESANGTSDFWHIKTGSYPSLAVFSGSSPVNPEGSGSKDDPYLIVDANDLGAVWYHPFAHYHLVRDIDLHDMTWGVAVVSWFGGSFDGNGKTIRHLYIKGGGCLGLFGRLAPGADVSNLALEGVDFNGAHSGIGALAAGNLGHIFAVYSSGSVTGYRFVGGLVGSNAGFITSSYTIVSVSGERYIGGLVGWYNSKEAVVTACFWDAETSGSAGWVSPGLSTSEMQNIDTYLDAGWDFVGETANGTEDIWWMPEEDYPKFWWQVHHEGQP